LKKEAALDRQGRGLVGRRTQGDVAVDHAHAVGRVPAAPARAG
jgi:hypothetical protein